MQQGGMMGRAHLRAARRQERTSGRGSPLFHVVVDARCCTSTIFFWLGPLVRPRGCTSAPGMREQRSDSTAMISSR